MKRYGFYLLAAMAAASLTFDAGSAAAQGVGRRDRAPDRPAARRGQEGRPQRQDDREVPPEARPGRGPGRMQDQARGQGLPAVLNDLDLTTEQKQQVDEIMREHWKDVQAYRRQQREQRMQLQKELIEARREKDSEAIERIEKKIERLMEGRRRQHENLISRLDKVLDDEQMGKLKEFFRQAADRPEVRGPANLRGLGLSDDQQKQVDEILAQARTEARDKEDEQAREVWRRAMAKIHQDVLTDEQREQVRRRGAPGEAGPDARFDDLDLTAKQRAELRRIREQAAEKLQNAQTRQERMRIHRQAMQQAKEVLTEKQRAQLQEKLREGMRQGPGRRSEADDEEDSARRPGGRPGPRGEDRQRDGGERRQRPRNRE